MWRRFVRGGLVDAFEKIEKPGFGVTLVLVGEVVDYGGQSAVAEGHETVLILPPESDLFQLGILVSLEERGRTFHLTDHVRGRMLRRDGWSDVDVIRLDGDTMHEAVKVARFGSDRRFSDTAPFTSQQPSSS